MNKISELTGIYSLDKTLRFELKPVGNTLANLEKNGELSTIAQDRKLAEEYKVVKKIIDRYHKAFISMSLREFRLNMNSLEEYVTLAEDPKRNEDAFDKIKAALRKQIVDAFKKSAPYVDLFKKELIQKYLPEFVSDADEKKALEDFSKFTSYFTGFYENRKNMYSDEDKSTAIAYRIIHENLPTFLDNVKSFAKIAESEVSQHFAEIEKSFSEYLNVEHLHEMFALDYFSDTLTQEQIAVYNSVLGGRTLDDGTKLQGINEFVNLHNQQNKDARLPLLKPLYKMILSDRVALSWLPEEFASDEEMTVAINATCDELNEVIGTEGDSLRNLLLNIDSYDIEHIYISNDLGLSDISQKMFGEYSHYASAIKQELRETVKATPKERREPELYDDRINKLFKSAKSFSIAYLNKHADAEHCIQNYFKALGAFDRDGEQGINHFSQIEIARSAASDVLAGKHGNVGQSDAETELIKNLLDAYKSLQHFIKPLLGSGDEADKDNEFYAKLRDAWDALDVVTPLYNKVRNWLTRKPYSTEKIKLNFGNSQLLWGWDVNKEPDCSGVLLRKDGVYYLGIMDKNSRHAFDKDKFPCDGACYEKIDYKLLPGANKMLPKVFFSKSRIAEFAPSKEILDAYQKGTHKKGDNFSIADCHRLIDFFKASIAKHKDWSKFPFHFSPTESYDDISGFYREVEQQGYMLGFRKVSEKFVNNLVNDGKLYLFKIWNKDFSEHSKGTPNTHTMYWKMLFDKRNLDDVVYKLNGQAEVFWRKASIDEADTIKHPGNHPIANKNKLNAKPQSTFSYDIIKDRRYTVDKFLFHVPMSINFKAMGRDNINDNVLNVIRHGGIRHIIGIDRGERHLLYLSMIDLKGNIVKQMTLNQIINEYRGNTYSTDYHGLLTEREGNRDDARRNWKRIENIKDLKQGYLSQVVHIISKMMVDNDAIVVLEDLNMGFMRGRQKIERSVYEQFERKLIDKLNYYVDKKKDANEPGGLLHALQLANKFESFRKLGKQSGCLFYIPAWNTSKIDPVTGFVNLFDTRYINSDKTRLFFSKFDSIRYNADKDWFEFAFDYSNFTDKAEGARTQWTLCTYGTRIRTFRNPEKQNQWDNEEVVLTENFKSVFADAGIDISGNLKEAICSLGSKGGYLERLMANMKLLLQMRNSVTNSEVDYILSPVADDSGNFYDSRRCGDALPQDADANGAYNIARKGLWALMQIRNTAEGDRPNLAIKNKEWLNFAQQKPYKDE